MKDGVFDATLLRAMTAIDDNEDDEDDEDEDDECGEFDGGGDGDRGGGAGGGATNIGTSGGTRAGGGTFIDPKASAEQIVRAFIELFKKVLNINQCTHLHIGVYITCSL